MNRNTPALLAAFLGAPEPPADSNERIAVDWVRHAATATLPNLTTEQLGDALMHFVSFFDSILDSIGEADPVLDWESRTHITRNIIGVAGAELYTAKAVEPVSAGEPA